MNLKLENNNLQNHISNYAQSLKEKSKELEAMEHLSKENQPRLGQRRSGGSVGMLRKLRENTPHGTGLQSDDHFGTALPANAVDDRQIPIEQLLIQHKAGRR